MDYSHLPLHTEKPIYLLRILFQPQCTNQVICIIIQTNKQAEQTKKRQDRFVVCPAGQVTLCVTMHLRPFAWDVTVILWILFAGVNCGYYNEKQRLNCIFVFWCIKSCFQIAKDVFHHFTLLHNHGNHWFGKKVFYIPLTMTNSLKDFASRSHLFVVYIAA